MDANTEHERLKNCGLVHHERQLDSHRYVGPAERRLDGTTQIKVLPLTQVDPKPGLEIHATDGEKYLLPHDFKGGWFDVVSPKGRKLVA